MKILWVKISWLKELPDNQEAHLIRFVERVKWECRD